MGGIRWIALFVKLASVETIGKESQRAFQRIRAARKTTRFASQACQVVTQFSIIGFDRVGVRLAHGNFVPSEVIPKPLIDIQPITVIPLGFGCLIQHVLDSLLSPYPNHRPAQNAAGSAIYNRQNIDFVFLSPINVNTSSISASFTAPGIGVAGRASAWSVIQRATVR